jgi:hypothetical protein
MSVNRLIQVRSAHKRWLSVSWMEPKNAPRARRRSASESRSAVPYRFSFCQRL